MRSSRPVCYSNDSCRRRGDAGDSEQVRGLRVRDRAYRDPVATVSPGETFAVETADAFENKIGKA